MVSPIALWGKMPCRGDFIRHNLPYEQGEALQVWVSQKRKILSPAEPESPPRKVKQGIPWHSLEPQKTNPRQSADPLTTGQAAQPWCFLLPPESLPFSTDRYLIGVWMDSSDKVGREYPLMMFQTATARWVKQYFAAHAEQPCEWLFHAARMISNSIYAQEDEIDRPIERNGEIDPITILVAQLNAIWSLYAPNWRHFLGKRLQFPGQMEEDQIQRLVGSPHPDDPVRHQEGVRFLPWANWPDCVLNPHTHEYFWQQDLRGRFIGAVQG
ncbi:MAG: type VI secretion system-associated protein TagF [Zoogloeaceae bacterium]|nr:type VI secretion system-associated protein TagF [Zoogloeaceae bacterium]